MFGLGCSDEGDEPDSTNSLLLAYLPSYDTLRIVNINNPAVPVEEGKIHTAGRLRTVAVSGNYAYAADYNDGTFYVFDVMNHKTPTLVGTCTMPEAAINITVSGYYAFVSDCESGLRIIDISTPAAPNEVGYYNDSNYTCACYVDGDTVYVAADDAFLILDITDRHSPVLVGSWTGVGPLSSLNSVVVDGDYAYVSDIDHAIRVIDISNPEVPEQASSEYIGGNPIDVRMSGGTLYLLDWSAWVGYTVFGGVHVLTVSGGWTPYEEGSYTPMGFDGQALQVRGNYAYVATLDGLKILNIANPLDITQVGILEYPSGSWDIAIQYRD